MGKKTDNGDLKAKLDLRRHFLRKYHADGMARVVDCCQATGRIWGVLRNEVAITNYWGMDAIAKPGRLKLQSERYLAQAGWPENVVDIDTYGVPWKHWIAMLPNVVRPTTVFLTIGRIAIAGGSILSRQEEDAIGLRFPTLPVPQAFGKRISEVAVSYLLARCCDFATIAVDAVEAVSSGNARYIGVRLEPSEEKRPAEATTPAGPHKQAERSLARGR